MQRSICLAITVLLLGACAAQTNPELRAAGDEQMEKRIWSQASQKVEHKCGKASDRANQMKRQACVSAIIEADVRPRVSFPDLVDELLQDTTEIAQDYSQGKISRPAYVRNVGKVTKRYWANWQARWDSRVASGYSPGYLGEESNPAIGAALLGGISGYTKGVQARQEQAERNKAVYCTTYGVTTTCR